MGLTLQTRESIEEWKKHVQVIKQVFPNYKEYVWQDFFTDGKYLYRITRLYSEDKRYVYDVDTDSLRQTMLRFRVYDAVKKQYVLNEQYKEEQIITV